MKINSNSINQGIAQGLGAKDRVTKSGDSANPSASKISQGMLDSSAKVNISEKAKEMARVKELANQSPDVVKSCSYSRIGFFKKTVFYHGRKKRCRTLDKLDYSKKI